MDKDGACQMWETQKFTDKILGRQSEGTRQFKTTRLREKDINYMDLKYV